MKIRNPHDKFFKETFGNVEVAKDFLSNYLPWEVMRVIDMNTLEPQKDSFINEELQENFSDLLFKVDIKSQEGYIYFLFEHKSYQSKATAIQLLKYMIEIWDGESSKENVNELPIVIPLVIYHGANSWNAGSTLGEVISGFDELPSAIQRFIPNFDYLLYDISKYTDDEIKGEAQVRILLTVFRDIFTKNGKELLASIFTAIKYLRELDDHETGLKYFETLMRYIFSAGQDLTKSDVREIIKEIEIAYPEGSDVAMTLAEQYREEGIEQAKKEVARNMLKEGIEYSLIEKLTGITKKEIERIAEEADN